MSSLFHACLSCRLISGAVVDFSGPLAPVANGLEAVFYLALEKCAEINDRVTLAFHLEVFASLSIVPLIAPMKTMLCLGLVLTSRCSRSFPLFAVLGCV